MYSRGGPCCQVLIWMRGLFLFWMIPDEIYGTLFLAPFSWNIGILNTIGNRAVHCPGGHLVVTKRSTYIRSQSQNCVNSILGSSGTRICWWHCQKQVIICLSNFQGNLQQNFALIIRITILVIISGRPIIGQTDYRPYRYLIGIGRYHILAIGHWPITMISAD